MFDFVAGDWFFEKLRQGYLCEVQSYLAMYESRWTIDDNGTVHAKTKMEDSWPQSLLYTRLVEA